MSQAQVARLLSPRLRGLKNRWSRAGGGMRAASVLFLLFGLAFWGGLFYMMFWLIGAFHEVEVFLVAIVEKKQIASACSRGKKCAAPSRQTSWARPALPR